MNPETDLLTRAEALLRFVGDRWKALGGEGEPTPAFVFLLARDLFYDQQDNLNALYRVLSSSFEEAYGMPLDESPNEVIGALALGPLLNTREDLHRAASDMRKKVFGLSIVPPVTDPNNEEGS